MAATAKNFVFIGLSQEICVPGKVVDGVVVVVIAEPQVRATALKIHWQGIESVGWYQGVRQNELRSGVRQLLGETLTLWTPSSGDDLFYKGTYTYPFRWELPRGLPGSYEEPSTFAVVIPENGIIPKTIDKNISFIRYTVKASLERIDIFDPVEPISFTQQFNVIEDFNIQLLSQPPKVLSESKTFLFQKEPLECHVTIANGGVIFLGQKLNVKIQIDNKSSRTIDSVNIFVDGFTIMQNEVKGEDLLRKDALIAHSLANSSVKGNSTWSQLVSLDLSKVSQMSIRKGQFIQKHYELSVEVSSKLSSNLTIKAPILILGWSPLLGVKETTPELAASSSSVPSRAEVDLELEDVSLQSPPTSPPPTSVSPHLNSSTGTPPPPTGPLVSAGTVPYGATAPIPAEPAALSPEDWSPSSPSQGILTHRDPGAKLLQDSPLSSDDDVVLH